jgi:hypothetical protein
LTNRLRLDYFERYKSLSAGANVTGTVDLLEAQASGGERVPVHVRCARSEDGLVIDLGDADGRAVIVRQGRWRVAASPPSGVLFRRTRMTAALPQPVRGGSLDELRDLINVSDEGWDLVRAWSAGAPARRTCSCCAARISRSAVRTRLARIGGHDNRLSCPSGSHPSPWSRSPWTTSRSAGGDGCS